MPTSASPAAPAARWRRSTSTSPAARRRPSASERLPSPSRGRWPGSRRRTAASALCPGRSWSRPRSRSPEAASRSTPQAYLHAILDVILRHTEEGRRLFGGDAPMPAGAVLVQPELANVLELFAAEGAGALYHGDVGSEVVRHLKEHGGAVTMRDLREYRVIRRRPLSVRFRGCDFRSNPPPATGGILVCFGLEQLYRREPTTERLLEVMDEQRRARDPRFSRQLYRGGLAKRLLGVGGGTTHISAVDAQGNAASLSVSTGSGSGIVAPGTG